MKEASCGFESIEGMLQRNKQKYLKALKNDLALEERKTFNFVLGNCAILSVEEDEKVFEDFIDWLRKFRKEKNESIE